MGRRATWAVVAVVLAGAAWAGPSRAGAPRPPPATTAAVGLPRLVDLGAGRCVPCKAMAPILEALRVEYAGRMDVVFIDVWKDRAAGEAYGVHMIPTQIFIGADGRELSRHEGFMARADILARWKSHGLTF